MRARIREAFLAVHGSYPPDRIVADPDLNQVFIAECRRLGLSDSAKSLNLQLLNLRKAGDLKGLPRSRRTTFKNEEEYRFASEVAGRHLERYKSVSIDEIICDPELVQEFDAIATSLAPGFTPLQYRWAALNLRKAKKLRPELLSRVAPAEEITLGLLTNLDVIAISSRQGLYVFYDPVSKQTLYVGEATNLRKRLEKHLDHSDNKNLAHWLWEHGFTNLYLEVHLLPQTMLTRVRRALEAELIASRKPVFNILGTQNLVRHEEPGEQSLPEAQKQDLERRLADYEARPKSRL
jgi:predicted GIY-YIG superfamily endonuclease